jgi:formamidopyrimidine-DNA glycosylase
MPELPEVESVRRTLAPLIVRQTINRVVCAPYPRLFRPGPEEVAQKLAGHKINKLGRLGKLIILTLSKGAFATIHLGMTGQLICALSPPEAGHIHMSALLSHTRLFFRDPRRFGQIAFYGSAKQLAPVLARMGPDALIISDEQFYGALIRHRAPIKTTLLNQSVLAGVGNIYADEALFMARLSPRRLAGELSRKEGERLNQALKEVMNKSLAMGGSTVKNFVDAAGRPGTFQETHQVYQKTGQPCPVCGAAIQKMVLGGRATHYCPVCQP